MSAPSTTDVETRPGGRVLGGLVAVMGLALLGIFAAYLLGRRAPPGSQARALPPFGQVTDFTLTNQFGRAFSLADLRGQVWVADIIFTRCPGPCATMSRRLSELQQSLPPGQPVRLVSLTADPDFDTPVVLKAYAERFRADPARWTFLTGPKPVITRLAVKELLLVVVEKPPQEREYPEDLFLHSTKFILVDRRGRLRGVYDGESGEARGQLLEATRSLLRERGE